MATPITWQNISGPDLAAASRPLEAAQRSFNGVFDQLGSLLQQREKIGEQNWQNTKTNNTQAFLDKVAQYRTPEELAAAQQSGALDQMRQQFGAQIDPNAIRGAADQRLAALYQQTNAANTYTDQKQERAARPFVDQFNSLMAQGKFDEARAITEGNVLPNEGKMELDLRNMRRLGVVEGQQDTTFGNTQTTFANQQEMHPLELAARRAQTNSTNQQIAESQARVSHMGDEAKDRRSTAAAAKAAAALGNTAFNEEKANGAYSMGSYGTKEGRASLYDALKNIPGLEDEDKEDILYNLEKHFKDGINVPSKDAQGKIFTTKMPLPISAVVQAIESAGDTATPFFSRRGDNMAQKLAERFGLRTGMTADYKTPSRDFDSKYDKDLVDSMTSFQTTLVDRQIRAQNAQQRSADAKKALMR